MSGFSIIELVVVMVLLAILSAVAVMAVMPRAGENTAGYQAGRLASDLRHTQMLAMAWGKNLNFATSPGSYSVSCASGSTCTSTPVSDPGHSGSFDVSMESVTLSATANPLTFDIVGRPSGPATFTLAVDGVTVATVTVAANTGFVAVQ